LPAEKIFNPEKIGAETTEILPLVWGIFIPYRGTKGYIKRHKKPCL